MDSNKCVSWGITIIVARCYERSVLKGRRKRSRHQRSESRIKNSPLPKSCSFERCEKVIECKIVHVEGFGCSTAAWLRELVIGLQSLDLIIRDLPKYTVADENDCWEVLPTKEAPKRNILRRTELQDASRWLLAGTPFGSLEKPLLDCG